MYKHVYWIEVQYSVSYWSWEQVLKEEQKKGGKRVVKLPEYLLPATNSVQPGDFFN